MKGWKTLVIMAGVALAGWLEQMTGYLKECQIDPQSHVELCQVGVPGWAVGLIGMLGMVLRFFTTTPVGKK